MHTPTFIGTALRWAVVIALIWLGAAMAWEVIKDLLGLAAIIVMVALAFSLFGGGKAK